MAFTLPQSATVESLVRAYPQRRDDIAAALTRHAEFLRRAAAAEQSGARFDAKFALRLQDQVADAQFLARKVPEIDALFARVAREAEAKGELPAGMASRPGGLDLRALVAVPAFVKRAAGSSALSLTLGIVLARIDTFTVKIGVLERSLVQATARASAGTPAASSPTTAQALTTTGEPSAQGASTWMIGVAVAIGLALLSGSTSGRPGRRRR